MSNKPLRMITLLMWKKIGMSQIISDSWNVVPVTYIEVWDNEVVQVKTEDKDWYNAVVLWADPCSKPTKTKKFKSINECKLDSVEWLKVWDKFDVGEFAEVGSLTVTWFSKGKWFAGPVKRWNRSVIRKTHWTKYARHGTTMNCSITGRSKKWIKMAWRMWNDRVTLKNREIPLVDIENKVIAIKWAVPWAINGLVILKKED